MTDQPKVSVIFPIYNNEKYIEQCIRSVMNQTLKEIELILIDDGSKDGAPAILDRLGEEDDRIVVIHKENEGSAAGRNLGIDTARGEYVAFVESDDSVEPDMYRTLYELAKEKQADIVKCGFYFCENGEKDEKTYFYEVAEEGEVFTAVEKPMILFYHASIWAGIYRKQFLDDHQLRCIVTPSATYSDFSFAAMTIAYAERITVCHKAFYNYNYENPDSSRVVQGEKCYYKPFHCKEANRILREAGIFEQVKEEIGFHQFRTCMGHAKRIRKDLREEYFRRLRDLMLDTTSSGYTFKYFTGTKKVLVDLLLADNFKGFYRIVDRQIFLRTDLAKVFGSEARARKAYRIITGSKNRFVRTGRRISRVGRRISCVGRRAVRKAERGVNKVKGLIQGTAEEENPSDQS